MITVEEKLKKDLFDRGMFESWCDVIMETVKAYDYNEPMQGRWQDDIDGYPPQLVIWLWLSVKQAALEYIDTNCPGAWFRPMFV